MKKYWDQSDFEEDEESSPSLPIFKSPKSADKEYIDYDIEDKIPAPGFLSIKSIKDWLRKHGCGIHRYMTNIKHL